MPARAMRLAALLIVAIALAPGTWLRSPLPAPDYLAGVTVKALAIEPLSRGISEGLTLSGAWLLSGANSHFGGYSALVSLGDGRLLAGSDRARTLVLDIAGPDPRPGPLAFVPGRGEEDRSASDMEAMTRDPATGTIWAAFENHNLIERHEPGTSRVRRIHPDQIRRWNANGGPESLVRLADGRFVVIKEADGGMGSPHHPALLFEDDPLSGDPAIAFELAVPDGYSPVDAAQLPDGRVMIVLRRVAFGVPPRFSSALMVADPAQIAPDALWRGTMVGRIAGPAAENYEGLAVVPAKDGAASLYLISDDNLSRFQRTMLLRLEWPGRSAAAAGSDGAREKAREKPRAP